MERCPGCQGLMGESPVCRRCGCDFSFVFRAEKQARRLAAEAITDILGENRNDAMKKISKARLLDKRIPGGRHFERFVDFIDADKAAFEERPREDRAGAEEKLTSEIRLVMAFRDGTSRRDLQRAMGLKNTEHFRVRYILPAMKSGLIEMTIPDRPTCRFQKYRLTAKGWALQNRQRDIP